MNANEFQSPEERKWLSHQEADASDEQEIKDAHTHEVYQQFPFYCRTC